MKILTYICTRGRYDSTLPMAMLSLINQTRRPDKLIVFDDNTDQDKRDPRQMEHYMYLFKLMEQKGIPWEWVWAKKLGAHHSHEMANTAGFDLAWFIDDDCVAEPTCLEMLLKEMHPNVGAVGGLILQPPAAPLPSGLENNKIHRLDLPNIQWFVWDGPSRPVEHIYSQFLYRCDIVHHDLRLSSVVFRGETMFTHSLLLKGYQLLVTPKAVTWHFQTSGGVHSGQKQENWAHDEAIFREWLAFAEKGRKIFVFNGGLGDHLMALQALEIPKGAIVSCCYPDVFKGMDVEVISIAAAERIVDINPYDVYAWAGRRQWTGHLIDAYKALYAELHR